MSYRTKLFRAGKDTEVIMQAAKDLHKHSRAIKQGADPVEHLSRVLDELHGLDVLAVMDGEEIVGAIAMYPTLMQNSHYTGDLVQTEFAAVNPLHQEATFLLVRRCMQYARAIGADWLILNTESGEHDVLTQGVRLAEMD